jgi:Protein of unknown function (DUF2860)
MKYSLGARSLIAVPLALLASAAMAAKGGITEEVGFSGNVLFGAGYLDIENSYIAGNSLIDVKNSTISGFGSPNGESDIYPVFTGEVNYTFEDRWQLFFGNDLEDLATLDTVQKLGVRKQWDGVGVMGGSLLLSGIPGEVWEDPYLLNVSRSDTDRDSMGIQFDWYRILNSNFFLTLNTREIDIDNEQSGQQFCNDPGNGIVDPSACLNSLRRDGDDSRLSVGYRWKNGSSVWEPQITVGEDDRDGNAISRDVMALKLSYSYLGEVWIPVASVAYLDYEYDATNPVFNQRTDADGYAVSFSVFRKLELWDGNWSAVGNVVVSDIDSRVNFNDSYAFGLNAGVNYAFGN